MRVREIMTGGADVLTIEAGDSVGHAVERLMGNAIGALPVVDRARSPVGLISERDIARALHEHPEGAARLAVQRIMRRPPPLCALDDDIREVMARMTRQRLRHLIVCDGGRIVGMLSVGDLLKHRLQELELETGVLRDYVAGQRSRF